VNEQRIVEICHEYVKENCEIDISAHDWWHIHRVCEVAKKLNVHENGNEFVVEMIALLHDVFDHKFYPDANIASEITKLLDHLGVKQYVASQDLDNIIHSISNMSFKGGFNQEELSREGKIVQDADRLDAIGAIAIARTFAYGGKFERKIYDPEEGIVEITSEEQYVTTARHSINHFYEKLLKLKDLMHTETAKRVAITRHQFMEQFLEQFFEEWNGTDF